MGILSSPCASSVSVLAGISREFAKDEKVFLLSRRAPHRNPFPHCALLAEAKGAKSGWKNWCLKNGVYLWWFFLFHAWKFYVYFIHLPFFSLLSPSTMHGAVPVVKNGCERVRVGKRKFQYKNIQPTQMCHILRIFHKQLALRYITLLQWGRSETPGPAGCERRRAAEEKFKEMSRNFYSNK
jgi:hypothetical protein